MLTFLEVNGAATEASAIEREMPGWGAIMRNWEILKLPAWAVLRAPQSLQPSPHMITCRLRTTVMTESSINLTPSPSDTQSVQSSALVASGQRFSLGGQFS